MSAELLDGKAIANEIKQELAEEVAKFIENTSVVPCLAAVLVGDDPASQVYVRNKQRSCERVGIGSQLHRLPAETTQAELLDLVDQLNVSSEVHGILVQLPLPGHIDATRILDAASPDELPEGTIEPYEGLLFPDTYFLATDATAAELLDQMIGRMDQVMTELGYGRATELVGISAYDTLIVASLIEREARVPGDRPKISRVIHNRLVAGWLLGIDATVVYATGDNVLTVSDLATESPYNTRVSPGLPPTPIASPGRAALEAAITPVVGQWIYYVLADESGRHAFSVSAEEFERDKQRCQDLGLCG